MTMPNASTSPTTRSATKPGWRRPRALTLGLGLVVLLTGLVAPASAFAATPTVAATDGSTAATCTGGPWPWAVQGAPVFGAGSAAGLRLWHSATGWHLRVTHPGTYRAVFSGTIRVNKPLRVAGFQLETEDAFAVSADGLTLTYRFVNHGHLDGLDFTTACATRIGVISKMSGVLLPARRIWLGRAGRHPIGNPFVILRRA